MSGSSSQSSSSQSPGDSKPQGGQTANSRQEQGERQPGEEKPEPGSQDQQTANADRPDRGGENPEPTEQRPANQQPDQATQAARPVAGGSEDWGNLPVHVRELFRAEGGRDLPPRYRDWIDSYYRRLNRRSGGN